MNGLPSLHLFSYPLVNMILIKNTRKANVTVIIRPDLSKINFWASYGAERFTSTISFYLHTNMKVVTIIIPF